MDIKKQMEEVANSDLEVHVKAAVLMSLNKMLEEDKDEPELQDLKAGDVVKYDDELFIVAQIFDVGDYTCGESARYLAITYSPMRKCLDYVFNGFYEHPEYCQIITHINPKMIFREDVKCV